MKYFHERLKMVMKEQGVSQNKLAQMLGVTQASVWEWCNTGYPSMERFTQICDMLNTTPNYLLGVVE